MLFGVPFAVIPFIHRVHSQKSVKGARRLDVSTASQLAKNATKRFATRIAWLIVSLVMNRSVLDVQRPRWGSAGNAAKPFALTVLLLSVLQSGHAARPV